MRIEDIKEMIIQEADTQVTLDEPMENHTSLRIGGPADIFVSPKGIFSLKKIIEIAKANCIKHFIIANGTNILVSDEGIRGMVIQIKSGFGRITVNERDGYVTVEAEAGARLSRVLNMTKKLGLTGFEFAAGIPGSIGGAIIMNAGTRLGSVSDALSSIEILTKSGKIKKISRDELDFGYRSLKLPAGSIVLNGVFDLKYGGTEILGKVDSFLTERRAAQPKGRSAGCIFKNPAGGSAGKIIDELGLKGKKIGGAYVSNVHANFIMNDGSASCKDFITLIREVRAAVKKKRDIKLEYEIKFLGNM